MSGEENIAEAARCYLLSEGCLTERYTAPSSNASSPIEHLFFKAIWLVCNMGVTWLVLGPGVSPKSNDELRISPQARVLDWPVDYLLTVVSQGGRVSQLVVECDGHEFHERTKEQAGRDRLRDRRLQEKGITVYPFTGSELYRDAFGCARQVIAWAEKAAWYELNEGS